MLGVCHGVTNDILEEDFEDTTGFLVNETRDTLDTTTASKTANGGLQGCMLAHPVSEMLLVAYLGYALDVVTKNLTVTLGTTLS